MKRILFAILAGIALAGCENKDTTKDTKDAVNQGKDAVDSAAKDAKKQIDAGADAAKAAATNATALTNK